MAMFDNANPLLAQPTPSQHVSIGPMGMVPDATWCTTDTLTTLSFPQADDEYRRFVDKPV